MRLTQTAVSSEIYRALEPVRRLPTTLAAALPLTDVTALQQPSPRSLAPPPGPSIQVRHHGALHMNSSS